MAADWVIQKGLYEALTGNAPLMAVVAGVHDVPPQQADSGAAAAYPVVSFGQFIATEADTVTQLGFSVLMRLHTWSRSGSMKETKTIQALLYAALHNQPLTVEGYSVHSVLRETSQVFREADRVFHGVCEYRALLEQSGG